MKNGFLTHSAPKNHTNKLKWGICVLFFLVVGSLPALAQPFAYVANNVAGNVSVIDTASNTVVAAVTVGNMPVAVAITPNGAFAYVTNFMDNTVSVTMPALDGALAGVTVTLVLACVTDGTKIHGSTPCVPSLAEKNSVPPTLVRSSGYEP